MVAKLLRKAQKYMNAKDAVLAKEMKGKRKRDEGTSNNRNKKKETRSVEQTTGKKKKELPNRRPKFTNFTPLIMPIEQMKMDKKRIRPFTSPLVSFTGDRIVPRGIITLTITAGIYPAQAKSSDINILLESEISNNPWVGEIKGDQVLAKECYQTALASRENHTYVINEPEPIFEPSETLQEVEVILGDLSKVLKIGLALSTREKEKMVSLLRANQDVFVWKHEDMPGIDRKIIQHRLNINPECKPVQHKRRIFALERNRVVTEEVKKLLEAGFIKEVFYPDCLANMVMVKKSNDKWRMYVDFIDLNQACSKDSFPLSRIDQLVDSTAGYKLLSFTNAFSRYN
ncbi:uncharacterized protein LOC142624083 [Castanea sativa]|uniref:uncharacterized protein LOC142624083 n=1 Tax=Castanea sativa TaxID=21020 RepID=UPI003F64DA7D